MDELQVGSAEVHAELAKLAHSVGDAAASQSHWSACLQSYFAALQAPIKVKSLSS